MANSLTPSLGQKLLFIIFAVFVLTLDQWSKHVLLAYVFSGGQPITVSSFFNIVFVQNPGVSFGFLNYNHPWSAPLLIVLAGGITLGLIMWLWNHPHRLGRFGLSLVIGGAIGNIIDRIRFGAVTDFLDFHWQGWHWPTFNVADIAISCGVALLIGTYFYQHRMNEERRV